MSKILRQAIVPIAAVAGTQLVYLFLSPPSPGQSSSCLQWANEAYESAVQALPHAEPPRVAEDGYYDVRKHKDVALPPGTAPVVNHADASSADSYRTEATPAIAGTVSAALPDGMSEADYQARRREFLGGAY